MGPRDEAIAIWKAGVAGVQSENLVRQNVQCESDSLNICGRKIPLPTLRHIEIVGAGKAGAGMARGMLAALRGLPPHVTVSGWVNVPEDCSETLDGIILHPARPAGINEPTRSGVEGTQEILKRVGTLGPADLCIALISGGGSALLPAPVPEISLDDKLLVTRILAGKGAPIEALNVVRSQLSLIKGGGLLQHCRSGSILTLIISDVIGDPLDIIASGPTTPRTSDAVDALAILTEYDPDRSLIPERVYRLLESGGRRLDGQPCPGENFIIGSNAVALAAAAQAAKDRGYQVISLGSENSGAAAAEGRSLFRQLQHYRDQTDSRVREPVCLLAGGETTVRLAQTSLPRRGGRNQEVVLGAVAENPDPAHWNKIVLLSGGTDGEDGPTDAAGAVADTELLEAMTDRGLPPAEFLAINNSYPFFAQLGGLLQTGPTHTNVMDIAVGLVGR